MTKTIYLWTKEEYRYPCAGGFLPNITAYLHDDEKLRPAMLVVPGGGYALVSPTEGEIVAKKFFEEGSGVRADLYDKYVSGHAAWKTATERHIQSGAPYQRQCGGTADTE